jgi:hypothetical protein
MLIYTWACAGNSIMNIDACIDTQKHNFLGNSHTVAPEVKVRSDVASQFGSNCRSILLFVLPVFFRCDETQSAVCYFERCTRLCCVSTLGVFCHCLEAAENSEFLSLAYMAYT